MNTIEAVCNAALDAIGYKRHIGSIFDGTPAARIALDIWGQTRDELLSALQPDWARKDAELTILRQAPVDYYQSVSWNSSYPPLPWLFEYAFASDMLVPLQIKDRPLSQAWRPRYVRFRTATDAITGVNCILTDQAGAIATYIAQVLDPVLWHDDYTAAMIQRLVQQFAPLTQGAPSANEARRPSEQSAG
jgi:hypothetical protein